MQFPIKFKEHRAYLQRLRRQRKREASRTLPLPELGHIVRDIEGRVQCHLCGCFFSLLDPHLRQLHGWTIDDYREEFQLNRTQAMCSPSVSEVDRQTLVKSGWAGKLKDYELSRFAESRKMRLQACLTQSKVHTGVKLPITPARIVAAKANYQKALIMLNCEVCRVPVMAHKAHKHVYCEKCRPVHKHKYGIRWRMEHLAECKQYSVSYHKTYRGRKERGEVKAIQMTDAKLKAQKANQLLSLVKNTQYSCSLCSALFYGRPCESHHGKHYCPKCKPIARNLTIREWHQTHREAARVACAKYRAKLAGSHGTLTGEKHKGG